MKYTWIQHHFHCILWIFAVIMDTKMYGAAESGLPVKVDAKKNSLLRLYDVGNQQNTTAQPKIQAKPCEDAINTALRTCDSKVKDKLQPNSTFRQIAEILFDFQILDKLQSCTNATWCLSSSQETKIVSDLSEKFLPYCSVGVCLLQMDYACLRYNQERRLALATLLLLCKAHEMNMTPNCMLSLRKMSHVTMAPYYHKFTTGGNTSTQSQVSCSPPQQMNCTGTCPEVAKQLYCTCATCDHQMHLLKEFGPWQWFYNSDKMEICGISNSTDCSLFNDPAAVNYQMLESRGDLWNFLSRADFGVLIGAGIAGGATFILFLCLLVFCLNRLRHASDKRHYIHYTEITSRETDDLTKGAFSDCNVVDLNKVYEPLD